MSETIAALATAYGIGSVSIVRLSGKDALATIYGRQGEEVVLAVSKQGNRQFAVMHWRR